MNGFTRAVVAAAVLGAVGAGEARALDVTGSTVHYCLNLGGMNACASASITVSGSTLTAVIKNMSNTTGDIVIGRLTEFGFFYLDSAPTGGSATFVSENLPTTWQNQGANDPLVKSLNAKPWLGHVGDFIGGSRASSEWNDFSLAPGLSGTFTFNLTGSTDWSKIHFAWLGRSVGGATVSAKCFEGADHTKTLSPGECVARPATPVDPVPVPEPASMTLIALGLVAMGGAGIVRRRRAAK